MVVRIQRLSERLAVQMRHLIRPDDRRVCVGARGSDRLGLGDRTRKRKRDRVGRGHGVLVDGRGV